MAVKKDKSLQRGVSHAKSETPGRIVLVGTYKGDQLTDWRGWYNYPISDEDKITDADAAKITELWLFKGTKDERRYKAYLESTDRNDPDLAKRLPEIITKLRPDQLRVCEAAVQLNFWDIPQMQVLKPSVPFPSPVHQKFTLSIEKEAA